jgi:hypothetical protein
MLVEISEREYKLIKVFQEHPFEFLESLNNVIKDHGGTDLIQERQEHRLEACG